MFWPFKRKKKYQSYYTRKIFESIRNCKDDSVRVHKNGAVSRDVTRVRASKEFRAVFNILKTQNPQEGNDE